VNVLVKIKLRSICIFLFSLGIFLSLTPFSKTHAGDKPKKKKVNKWVLTVSISPYYDSNILKYSNKYIQRFENREDPGRFHINRIDDLAIGYSASLTFSDKFLGKMRTTLGAGYDTDAYTYNSVKTWATFGLYLRQQITSSTSAQFTYSYIPEFYVRHFRDDDWVYYYGYTEIAFQPYTFSKDNFALWVHQIMPWRSTRARFYFTYSRYFLNEAYTEYDSNDYMFGIRIYQTLMKNFQISFGYLYTTSDAKGYDEPNETKESSDDSDATNYEHTYFVGFELDLPRIFNRSNSINTNFQYQRAFFTTDEFVELDPLHVGRYEYNYRLFVDYNFSIIKNLSATLFYNWYARDASSPSDYNREYISDEKDYTQYRIGLTFNYHIAF